MGICVSDTLNPDACEWDARGPFSGAIIFFQYESVKKIGVMEQWGVSMASAAQMIYAIDWRCMIHRGC